jgi:predicted cupin superfamily sugar epimerase
LPAAMSATARSTESNLVISATWSLWVHSRPEDGNYVARARCRALYVASSMNHEAGAVIAAAYSRGRSAQTDGGEVLVSCVVSPGFDFDDFTLA